MKILDRYIIWTFIKNYLIAFFVLVGMYVVLDMVFNFDELAEVKELAGTKGIDSVLTIFRTAADYYFYQIFLIYVHLSGIIPVVAAAFTLMRLSRFNELSAILSAGVPLLRVAFPIILVALVLNGLLLVDQELVIPNITDKLTRSRQEASGVVGTNFYQIKAMRDDRNSLINVARYRPGARPPTMTRLTIIERNEDDRPVARIIADSATWDAASSSWKLTNATRISGMLAGQARTIENDFPSYKSNVTPEEIALYRSGDYVDYLSTERINQLLQRPQSYGVEDLLRVKHARFTQPLVNVILLLLAIPSVLTRSPTTLKAAATKCLFLTGACLGTQFAGHFLAARPMFDLPLNTWAAIVAALPIFLYGPIAVWLLDRVET